MALLARLWIVAPYESGARDPGIHNLRFPQLQIWSCSYLLLTQRASGVLVAGHAGLDHGNKLLGPRVMLLGALSGLGYDAALIPYVCYVCTSRLTCKVGRVQAILISQIC